MVILKITMILNGFKKPKVMFVPYQPPLIWHDVFIPTKKIGTG